MGIFERNVGILTNHEQQQLLQCRVAILGLGGLGGVIAQVLARSGIGGFSLVDFDVFDESNINRQVFAFSDTVGLPKAEVTRDQLLRINAELDIRLESMLTEQNTDAMLHDCDAVVLAADDIRPCLIAARYCRKEGIAVVEGWALPYCNARVFTADTPTLEECYGLTGVPDLVSSLSDAECKALTEQMILKMRCIEGVAEYFAPDITERVRTGRIPSFAPMVWFTAARMAIETIKVLLGRGQISFAPDFAAYDPFLHRIPTQD